ncbi:hypothetical protein BC830DRAFT_1118182 [Chytriomyces sp. MP71]|nr:hypothetical protein BC830DRAFT_1118182 [Chytriomyces sp. MP71]
MQDVILTEEIDTYNGEIINANTDTIIAYDDEIITVGSQQSICYSYLCNHVGDSVNQACYSYVHSPLRLHGSVTVSSSGAIQGKTIDETMKTFTRNKSQIIQKELVNVQKLDKAANQDIVGDQVIVEESVVTEAAVLAELSNHHVENADDIVVEEVRTVLTEAEVAAEIGSGISPDEDEIVIEESSAAVYNGDAYKNDRAIHVTELEDDIEVRALESQLEKASALTTTQETQSALSTSSFLDNIDSFFSADVSPVEDTPSGLDSFLTESSSLDFDLSKYSISSKFDTKAPVAEIEDETHEVVEEVLESRMVWPSEIEIDRLDEAISDETHVVESLETEEVVVDVPPARNESAASEVAVPSIHQGLDDKEGAAGLITENLLEFNAVEPEIDFVKAEGGFEGNNGEPVAQFQEAAPETDESAPVPADNVYNDLNRGENEDASIELKKLMDTEFADELAPSTESRDDMDAYFSSESIALPNSSEEPGSDFDLAVDFVAPSESREELEARDVDQLENPVELRDELDVYFAQPAEPITSDALYDMGLGEPDDSEAHEELDLEEPADSDARYELGNGEPTDSDKRDEFEAYFSSEPPGDSSVPEDELDEYFNIGDNTDLTAIADPSLNLGDQETDEDELDAYFSEDTSVPTQIDEPVEDVANPKTLDPLLKQPFADDLVGTEQPTRAFIADTIGQDNAGLKFDNDAAESEEVDGEDDFDFGDYGAEEAAEVEPLEAADPDPDAAAVDTDFDFDDYGIDEPFSGEASEEHDAGAV